MKSFRPLRMLGAITALLVGLFWLERVWEVWDAAGDPLARYNPGAFVTTWYGVGVVGELVVRLVLGVALLWLFLRLGSSKPLPGFRRIPV
jgi:hypothetical protein